MRPPTQANWVKRAPCATNGAARAMTLAVAAPRHGTSFAANVWSSCTSVPSAGNCTPCAPDHPQGKPKTKTSRWPQSRCWPPRTSGPPTTTLAAETAQMSSGWRRWRSQRHRQPAPPSDTRAGRYRQATTPPATPRTTSPMTRCHGVAYPSSGATENLGPWAHEH